MDTNLNIIQQEAEFRRKLQKFKALLRCILNNLLQPLSFVIDPSALPEDLLDAAYQKFIAKPPASVADVSEQDLANAIRACYDPTTTFSYTVFVARTRDLIQRRSIDAIDRGLPLPQIAVIEPLANRIYATHEEAVKKDQRLTAEAQAAADKNDQRLAAEAQAAADQLHDGELVRAQESTIAEAPATPSQSTTKPSNGNLTNTAASSSGTATALSHSYSVNKTETVSILTLPHRPALH